MIMSIFSQASWLRWLLTTGMKEDEEAMLQVSRSVSGSWDLKGRALGHDCAFLFKEKHCYIWYNVQEVRRLVGGQWRGQKCSTGRQFGESFEKNVPESRVKKTWWKLLRRDQEKQEWKAEDGQEATVLSEEGANWWWPEQGGHNSWLENWAGCGYVFQIHPMGSVEACSERNRLTPGLQSK